MLCSFIFLKIWFLSFFTGQITVHGKVLRFWKANRPPVNTSLDVNYFIIQLYTKGENFCVFSRCSETSVEALYYILCVLKLLLCFGILCEGKIKGKVSLWAYSTLLTTRVLYLWSKPYKAHLVGNKTQFPM